MNVWTETAKGRRAVQSITAPEMPLIGAVCAMSSVRFLDEHVQSWTLERWARKGGRYFIQSDVSSPLGAHHLGGGNSLERALIEAVCKVLDLEATKRRVESSER